ncbi:MAG: hypothetical protein ABSC34_00870 [Acidimicrobiales bacterium]
MARRRRVHLPRDPLLTLLTSAALAEIAWTIYLGWRLPRHYVANHWDLAWVGLDVAQILMLLLAAWAAWRGRALLILFASSAGTLLLLDAWFDVTTARHGDLLQSVLLALVVEVPSAIALFWITWRSVRGLADSLLVGSPAEGLPLRMIPLARRSPPSEEVEAER